MNDNTNRAKVCPCGQAFNAAHANMKYCDGCREERYNARHPLKVCTKCGQEKRDIGRNHRWCWDCRRDDVKKEIKEQRRQQAEEYWARRRAEREEQSSDELTREERIARYLEEYAKLSPQEQRVHTSVIIAWLADAVAKLGAGKEEAANPEEEAHADQDRIDREFGDLMEGLDL
jgi:hypothetical protein